MEEIIIYAAGNPDNYPVEFYDSGKESYQGIIPELLKNFSERTEYEIRYLEPGKKDRREQMAENHQVDIVSGCDGTEEYFLPEENAIKILETRLGGEEITYRIYITEAAPEGLAEELRSWTEGISQETKTGMLMKMTREDVQIYRKTTQWGAAILILTVVVLVLMIAYMLRQQRRQLAEQRKKQETDEITGIGNMEFLSHYFPVFVQDKNRILYKMFYFYFDAEKMERTGSHADMVEFMRCMAMILQEYTSDTDILARVSDNGFALTRLSVGQREEEAWLLLVLERIRSAAEKIGKTYSCDVTAGIYPLKAEDYDLNEILFNAAQGARMAKNEGIDYKYCTDEVVRAAMEEKNLQADVERALENDEFQLYIQFYVDARNGNIVGGEALSRWEHPERGLLSAGRFVPLMENAGLISQLDYYSLNKVCAFLEEIYLAGKEDFFVSCNFSRETFSDVDFAARCSEIIGKYQFARELLIFEITESAMIRDFAVADRNIHVLKNMGIRISLDDFGVGFTSFFDIQKYQFDGLKLDKSLIDNLGTDPGDVILRAMIRVGHDLGITVMAEGVEKEEQVRLLREMHCDVIQGFHFYQPVPVWEARRKIME